MCCRLNSSSVASFLSEAGRKLWSDRSKRWIVLADEESTVSSISSAERECPIKTLKDSLYKVPVESREHCLLVVCEHVCAFVFACLISIGCFFVVGHIRMHDT